MESILERDIAEELLFKALCKDNSEAEQLIGAVKKVLCQRLKDGNPTILPLLGTFYFSGSNLDDIAQEFSAGQFIQAVQQELGDSTQKSEKALLGFCHFIAEMIVADRVIELNGALKLHPAEKPAHLANSPAGQKVLMPAQKFIGVKVAPEIKNAGAGEVLFHGEPEVSEIVSGNQRSSLLFVSQEKDVLVETFENHFKKSGWKIQHATDVDTAKNILKTTRTYLVVVDASTANATSFCSFLRATKETSAIPLVVIQPHGLDPEKATHFLFYGNENLFQPFDAQSLNRSAEKALTNWANKTRLGKREIEVTFPTAPGTIGQALVMGKQLVQQARLGEREKHLVVAACREALDNASLHGNQWVKEKPIRVKFLVSEEQIEIEIQDCGEGFFWFSHFEEKTPGEDRPRNKIGIPFMKECLDILEYNELGNLVTLIKKIR